MAQRSRDRNKERYGITTEERNTLFEKQNCVCALCHISSAKRWYLDHNHSTKQIRGVICPRCNTLVGFIESAGIDLVVAALQYADGLKANGS